jgi:hypothetical protein
MTCSTVAFREKARRNAKRQILVLFEGNGMVNALFRQHAMKKHSQTSPADTSFGYLNHPAR